jgi:hypothetical protein
VNPLVETWRQIIVGEGKSRVLFAHSTLRDSDGVRSRRTGSGDLFFGDHQPPNDGYVVKSVADGLVYPKEHASDLQTR